MTDQRERPGRPTTRALVVDGGKHAETVVAVIAEMAAASSSERQGRTIDRDAGASMEAKKREGYF